MAFTPTLTTMLSGACAASAPTVRDVVAPDPALLNRVTRILPSRFGAMVRAVPALIVTFILLVFVPAARACSLDGIASLSVNGNVASINAGQATASTFRYWAPFTLLAVAPGDTSRFSENLSNVRLSIPKESASLPFRWSFGDGTTAIGQSVTHRYARIGWYRLTVQYYWPSHRQWLEFDSAEQHVVPQGIC
jgi:PKD domain